MFASPFYKKLHNQLLTVPLWFDSGALRCCRRCTGAVPRRGIYVPPCATGHANGNDCCMMIITSYHNISQYKVYIGFRV